jgi:hypothetical protein
MVFTKPFSFKNLRSLGFTDTGFIFKTKDELNSFFLSDVFALDNPPLLSPNVSFIRIPKETDLKEVEHFCKLQTHPCVVDLMISEPQSEI